jgi:hypothetical protein
MLLAFNAVAANPEKVITGNLTGITNWSNDTTYIIKGKVFVKNGGTLNIAAGTLIKGDTSVAGSALIVTRGAKIYAVGEPTKPIVFTANAPVGARQPAMWGGLVIAGNARINVPGGEAPFEGGNLTNPDGSTTDDKYGGLNDADNSGILKYVRIEFAGYPYQTNNELNSLTLGGVGSGTEIDYVQCSYGFDDAFEFFGGTVNAKHLVAFRGNDDDFDTDFGYRGKVQFAVTIRDTAIADPVSGANCFESDNDATGTGNRPYTAPVFSNVTAIGPKETLTSLVSPNHRSGAHIRRNSRQSVFNSIFMGYPTGLRLDGDSVHKSVDSSFLQVRNTFFAGCNRLTDSTAGVPWNITSFFNNAPNALTALTNTSDVQLTAPFAAGANNLLPLSGSSVLGAAAFTSTLLSDPFFDVVTYAGAFGSTNWMSNWTTMNPQNEPYLYGYGVTVNIGNVAAPKAFVLVPNPAQNEVVVSADHTEPAQITILDCAGRIAMKVTGSTNKSINVSELPNGTYFAQVAAAGNRATLRLQITR